MQVPQAAGWSCLTLKVLHLCKSRADGKLLCSTSQAMHTQGRHQHKAGSPPGVQRDGALEQGLLCAQSADGGTPIGVACQSHCSHIQAPCSMGQTGSLLKSHIWPAGHGLLPVKNTTARSFAWHYMLGNAQMCPAAWGQRACLTIVPA